MSVIQGLKDQREGPKIKGNSPFLKLGDGESVEFHFLQEVDESAANYNVSNGLAVGIIEHVDPEDFRNKFLCTIDDEGKCAGCEKAESDGDWRQRAAFFINILVNGKVVKIMRQSYHTSGVVDDIINYAEDYGTLLDRSYKLRRKGTGKDTTYSLTPQKEGDVVDASEFEVIDPLAYTNQLEYSEQTV